MNKETDFDVMEIRPPHIDCECPLSRSTHRALSLVSNQFPKCAARRGFGDALTRRNPQLLLNLASFMIIER
jgi:hypothetical protein